MRHPFARLTVAMIALAHVGDTASAQPASPAPDGCGAMRQRAREAKAAAAVAAGVRVDELIYGAGTCDEQDGAIDDAIAGYEEVRTRYPASTYVALALPRLGALYARTGRFAEAAATLEAYAQQHADQPGAGAALREAVRYRVALGDDDQAIADTRAFIATFGRASPDEAADAFFGLASIYERRGKPDAVLAHYQQYLKTYGDKGGAAKDVIARARIGELLWEQSCRVKPIDGLCVARTAAPPMVCGSKRSAAVRVIERDRAKVKRAMASFAAAIAGYERAGGRFPDGDAALARHAYAAARFYRADVDHEAFLRLGVPTGLDFDPARPAVAKRSSERFTAWFQDKQRLATDASSAYQALLVEVKDPDYAIAGAARAGQVAQAFAEALYAVEVPTPIRAIPEAVGAYCSTLTDVAEPLAARATEAYGACLETSIDLSWPSSWSHLCERELGQLDPENYPSGAERRPGAPAPRAPAVVEPAVQELPPAPTH